MGGKMGCTFTPQGEGDGHLPWRPLFTSLLLLFRSPVAAWFSSLDPTLSKNNKFWLLQEKFVKKFKGFSALQPKFGPNFSSKAPKMFKNFSSFELTLLSQINPFFRPLFGTPCQTSLLKKSWVPPRYSPP